MGLTDRLKDLKGKAEEAVAEHSEQIRGAVEKTATAADQRTGGKYHERIQQAGAKADNLVRSVGGTDEPTEDQGASAEAAAATPSPEVSPEAAAATPSAEEPDSTPG
jgi:hypothetical protein